MDKLQLIREDIAESLETIKGGALNEMANEDYITGLIHGLESVLEAIDNLNL